MKTIGLVGGTGWISSVEYYTMINEEVNRSLGGLNFAKCILYSLNYGEIDAFNEVGNQDGVYSLVKDASKKLITIGADCILLCANTLHMYAEKLENEITIPLIHIATATAREIKKKNLSKVGLLGTLPTMELDFYKSKLRIENIDTVIPEKSDRQFIHYTIMNELIKGIFKKEAKEKFLNIIHKLQVQGAEGIILGCTEIPLLINQDDSKLPLFNTTHIHSKAAVDFALDKA